LLRFAICTVLAVIAPDAIAGARTRRKNAIGRPGPDP